MQKMLNKCLFLGLTPWISFQFCSVCMQSIISIHFDRRNHRAFLYCYFLSILILFFVCAPLVAQGSDSGCQLLSSWRQQWGPPSCPHLLSPHTWVNHSWQNSLEMGCYSCLWGLLFEFQQSYGHFHCYVIYWEEGSFDSHAAVFAWRGVSIPQCFLLMKVIILPEQLG